MKVTGIKARIGYGWIGSKFYLIPNSNQHLEITRRSRSNANRSIDLDAIGDGLSFVAKLTILRGIRANLKGYNGSEQEIATNTWRNHPAGPVERVDTFFGSVVVMFSDGREQASRDGRRTAIASRFRLLRG
jgi:hypothetical protein